MKQEKKQRLIQNMSVILGGLIVAIAVHFFIIDNNDISSLKTSVRDISNTRNIEVAPSDLYFEKINDNLVVLKTSKTIKNITDLTLSITYNTEIINIVNIIPTNQKTKILNLANIDGIYTTILEWGKEENLIPNQNIIEIIIEKKSQDIGSLNIVVDTIEFSDSENNSYTPTTSSIQL